MEVKGLSATAIKDFLQCVLKVVFRFDRSIPAIKNDYARLGIAVHRAIEQFTRRMQKKQSFPDASDYEFITSVFINSAVEEGLEDMSAYAEGKLMVTEFVDRYDPSEEVLEIEKRFKCSTPDGVPITGAIDKVIRLNEDTIAIVDYKTSRNALPVHELETDIQLSMYDLAAELLWPEYKNRILVLDYVRINKQVSTYRTVFERGDFNVFLNGVWLNIQKLDQSEVCGRLNNLCGWCDYKTRCPVYSKFLNSEFKLAPLSEMTNEEFLEHWESIATKASLITTRQRELKMIANQRFMRGETIEAAGRELYSIQQSRTSYPVDKIVKLIPQEDILDMLSIQKSRLDKYLIDHPDLKDAVRKLAQVNYNAPRFKTRAIKEDYVDYEEQSQNEAEEEE